MAKYIILMM